MHAKDRVRASLRLSARLTVELLEDRTVPTASLALAGPCVAFAEPQQAGPCLAAPLPEPQRPEFVKVPIGDPNFAPAPPVIPPVPQSTPPALGPGAIWLAPTAGEIAAAGAAPSATPAQDEVAFWLAPAAEPRTEHANEGAGWYDAGYEVTQEPEETFDLTGAGVWIA